jgi:hypothetical protein
MNGQLGRTGAVRVLLLRVLLLCVHPLLVDWQPRRRPVVWLTPNGEYDPGTVHAICNPPLSIPFIALLPQYALAG